MFMLRAAGSMLLIYALFNAAFGLNRQELAWLISAFLLAIGGIALILAQPWSRIVVLATAVTAAVIGAISQVRMAQDGSIRFEDAVVAWALWSALCSALAKSVSRSCASKISSRRRSRWRDTLKPGTRSTEMKRRSWKFGSSANSVVKSTMTWNWPEVRAAK